MSDTTEPEPTFDELLARAKPREATAWILLEQELLDEHAELDRLMKSFPRGGLARSAEADAVAAQIQALEERIETEKVPIRFRGIGHRKWADLLRDHPPTPAQNDALKAIGEAPLDYDPETFPYVAISKSAISPKMTVEQVAELDDRLSIAQFNELWGNCLLANVGGSQNPKSLAAGLIRHRNGGSATIASPEGSLEASSSAE